MARRRSLPRDWRGMRMVIRLPFSSNEVIRRPRIGRWLVVCMAVYLSRGVLPLGWWAVLAPATPFCR